MKTTHQQIGVLTGLPCKASCPWMVTGRECRGWAVAVPFQCECRDMDMCGVRDCTWKQLLKAELIALCVRLGGGLWWAVFAWKSA